MGSGRAKEAAAGLLRAWFELNSNERRVVCLILALALIGLLARYWHVKAEAGKPFSLEIPGHAAKR